MKLFPYLFVLAACGAAPAPNPTPAQPVSAPVDSRCTAPTGWYEPGCGASTFAEGCYAQCTTTCGAGFTCTKVMSRPLGASYQVTDVCAIEHHICMPDSRP